MKRISRRCSGSVLILLTLLPLSTSYSAEISVAVATNFLSAINSLAASYSADGRNHVQIISGSSGKLLTQIQQGAPFDIMLSADAERPQMLEEQNLAVQNSRFTYALGRLVLWSATADKVDSKGKILTTDSYQHLAIANPKVAPYGKAAQQTLEQLKLWDEVQDRIVQGEDIGQTFQFAATGNAEIGFVALSQIINPRNISKGSYWLVPENLYESLTQQAVLLNRAKNNMAAQNFLKFLQTDDARKIIKEQGYGLPDKIDQ